MTDKPLVLAPPAVPPLSRGTNTGQERDSAEASRKAGETPVPILPNVEGLTCDEYLTFLRAMTPAENSAYWASLSEEDLTATRAKLQSGLDAMPPRKWWHRLLWLWPGRQLRRSVRGKVRALLNWR